MQLTGELTNLQLELIKTFKYQLADEQLIEIRNLLANYFAQKATEEMDRLWEENDWDESTMKEWSKEHMRTPYK